MKDAPMKPHSYQPEDDAMRVDSKIADSKVSHPTHRQPDRFKLPASSWWIPSLTAFVAALAIVTALA